MNDSGKTAVERSLKEFDSFLENPTGADWNKTGTISNSYPFLPANAIDEIYSFLQDSPLLAKLNGKLYRYNGGYSSTSGAIIGLRYEGKDSKGKNICFCFNSIPIY